MKFHKTAGYLIYSKGDHWVLKLYSNPNNLVRRFAFKRRIDAVRMVQMLQLSPNKMERIFGYLTALVD